MLNSQHICNMCVCVLLDGSGVQRDMAKAVQYFQLASHGGMQHTCVIGCIAS